MPEDLHAVIEQPPAGGWRGSGLPTVVLVHGTLDRAASFSRTLRRLPPWGFVTYDRRGYQGSRGAGVLRGVAGHAEDLIAIATAVRAATGAPGHAVGHSIGGDVVLAAAIARPDLFASIGAYEPPVPWLGFRRQAAATGPTRNGGDRNGGDQVPGGPVDPGDEAEQFFRRMVGGEAWDRLPAAGRASRRADGPAVVDDLASVRGGPLFDVMALSVPVLFGRGGSASAPHHRQAVAWLADHVPGAARFDVPEAGHGAHLTHPDAFAGFVRAVVAHAQPEPNRPTATWQPGRAGTGQVTDRSEQPTGTAALHSTAGTDR